MKRAADLEKQMKIQEEEEQRRREVQRIAREAEKRERARQIVDVIGMDMDPRWAMKAMDLRQGDANRAVEWLLSDYENAMKEIRRAITEEDNAIEQQKAKEKAEREAKEALV